MNPIQRALTTIDIYAAIRAGSEPNDLFPQRPEDKVQGELEKRFAEDIRHRIERGVYEPSPAIFVPVTKAGSTTRPAALLTLADRIVYEALVSALRSKIETSMLGDGIVLSPRANATKPRWKEFEASPLHCEPSYIARADIAGFYENIIHELLGEQLVFATGETCATEGLVYFLGRVMGSGQGVPQGLVPSDALATAYLIPVDAAMARKYVAYFRHGDDIRVGTQDYASARESIFDLETALRARGLQLNGPKSFVLKATSYTSALDKGDSLKSRARDAVHQARVQALEDDDEAIQDLIAQSDNEELGWAFFYHQSVSFDELIDQLADHLTPAVVEIAEKLLELGVSLLKDPPKLSDKEDAHFAITWSLARLASAKSEAAIEHLVEIIERAPEKTQFLMQYAMAQSTSGATRVRDEMRSLFQGERFHTPWELAWMLRFYYHHAAVIEEAEIQMISTIARDETAHPICRGEAIKVLGRVGCLDHVTVTRLWNILPSAIQPDILTGLFALREQDWPRRFLDSAKNEPINKVVLRQLENTEHTEADASSASNNSDDHDDTSQPRLY